MPNKARILTPEQRARKNEKQREWRKNNPDKVKAASKKQYADFLAAEEAHRAAMIAAGYDMPKYGRGRPRIGETRVLTLNAMAQRQYREGNDQWKEYNRTAQAEWTAANPERRREIARKAMARRAIRLAEQAANENK